MSDAPSDRAWLPGRLARLSLWLVPLLAAGVATTRLSPDFSITDLYLATQDLPVIVGMVVLPLLLARIHATGSAVGRPPGLALDHPRWLAFGLAALVATAAWVGAKLVFCDLTVSADESMARFDAQILSRGRLMAPVAAAWRPFEVAMAPSFLLPVAGGTHWASSYLPVNAAIQAVFLRLGDADLASALMAGVALLATFGVGRRLWPDRPARAWIAVALLGSSAQFLLTAMTPYAMTAHLAFNMVWLWLFLRRSAWSQIAAGAVAFAACGLHQVVFHPAFAAPLVLALWWERRWARAAFHTLVYVAAGLFWLRWFPTAAALSGATLPGHASTPLSELAMLLKAFTPAGLGVMAQNLLRFAAWQNPLAWPLWAVGALAAWRLKGGEADVAAATDRGVVRALAAGPALMCGFLLVVLPFQGHGWGYRYLHGFLGSISLVGALGLGALLDGRDEAGRAALWKGAAVATGVAVLALLPFRLLQAWRWTSPQAHAIAEMRAADADVVLIDSTGLFYGWDLARNDPWLRGRPKLMALDVLDEAQLAALCDRGRVAVFDASEGAPLGLMQVNTPPERDRQAAAKRAFLRGRGCGTLVGGAPMVSKPGQPSETDHP